MRYKTKLDEVHSLVFTLGHLLCRLILGPLLLAQMLAAVASAGGTALKAPAAARVNGTVISMPEFQRELERINRQKGIGAGTAHESALAELRREALENVIIRELLHQESIRQRISVDASLVDLEMEQVKGQFAAPGQFAESLRRIRMDEPSLREQVGRGLAIRALIDRSVVKDVAVTDDEVKRYYEQHLEEFTRQPQVRLSHILASVEAKSPEKVRKESGERLATLRKRLVGGEDFAGLAATDSDCQSRKKGGDIGWFAPGQLTPEMEKAVDRLKVGEVSEIVEDKFGLHIIKVTERRDAFTPSLGDVREKVRGLVRQEKGLLSLQRYVKGLRDAARVEILLRSDD